MMNRIVRCQSCGKDNVCEAATRFCVACGSVIAAQNVAHQPPAGQEFQQTTGAFGGQTPAQNTPFAQPSIYKEKKSLSTGAKIGIGCTVAALLSLLLFCVGCVSLIRNLENMDGDGFFGGLLSGAIELNGYQVPSVQDVIGEGITNQFHRNTTMGSQTVSVNVEGVTEAQMREYFYVLTTENQFWRTDQFEAMKVVENEGTVRAIAVNAVSNPAFAAGFSWEVVYTSMSNERLISSIDSLNEVAATVYSLSGIDLHQISAESEGDDDIFFELLNVSLLEAMLTRDDFGEEELGAVFDLESTIEGALRDMR